jgi:hypothetical protein
LVAPPIVGLLGNPELPAGSSDVAAFGEDAVSGR